MGAARYWLYMTGQVLSTLVLAAPVLTLGWLLPYSWRMELITLWNAFNGTWWLRLAGGVRVRAEGLEHLPPGACVVACNHQSAWETIYLCRLLRPASIVLKRSLLAIPLFGWGLWATRPIAIDRGRAARALRLVLAQGERRLAQGNRVLIFPEGTRRAPGALGPYRRTAAELALRSGAPLVPVAHNAGRLWPRGRPFRPGTIRIRIGPPMAPQGQDSAALTAAVRAWTQAQLDELESEIRD